MDKTYNDLMDIVNRTKKMNGNDSPRITRRVRRDEPMDEAVHTVRVVKPAKDLDNSSKPSLFAGKDAISKFLDSSKAKKKTTASKSKSADDKKGTKKKSTTKKSTTTKSSAKKSTTKKTETAKKPKAEPKPTPMPTTPVSTSLDMNDPRNRELYNALQGTLLAGGTDISDYMEETKLEGAANTLKTLKEKRNAEKINEEITKEQQEYEKLFTGSFYSEDDVKTDADVEQEETANFAEKLKKVSASVRQVAKEKRLDQDLEEIKSRDKEIDKKIADYYKQKQEKINKYNESMYTDVQEVEEQPKDSYEDRQQAYADIFSGEVVSRAKLLGEEETEEETDNKEETLDQVETAEIESEETAIDTDDNQEEIEESEEEIAETIESETNIETEKVDTEEIAEIENGPETNESEETQESVSEEPADEEQPIVEETDDEIVSTVDAIDDTESKNEEEIEKSEEETQDETDESELEDVETEQETEEVEESAPVNEFQRMYEQLMNSGFTAQADNTEDTAEETETTENIDETESQDAVEEIVDESKNEIETPVIEEIQEPVIDEETEKINNEAFVESFEESTYADDDYSRYDDEELDRMEMQESKKETYLDDELIRAEEDEFEEQVTENDNIFDLSQDDELSDYILSSNVPDEVEEEVIDDTPLQEYVEEDNALVLDTRALPESQIDVSGEEFETKVEEKVEEEIEEKEESDSISKEEFYNEMARLQENLINELKGQKVETESRDFFEEKPKEEIKEEPKNSSLDKALDIINNLTNKPVAEETKEEPQEDIEDTKAKELVDSIIDEIEKDDAIENIVEPEEIDETQFEGVDLLNKEVALNDEDLKFFDESQKPRDLEKDACFYMSDEDKDKKAEFEDEYLTVYDDESAHNVEVGDINLNKDIQNAVPLSQIFKNSQKEETKSDIDDEMETIYTLFGVERKKMEKQKEDIKVLYVASECQPFAATGGLADVAGSLPKAIAEIGGVDIRVIMPLYGNIKKEYRDEFEYLGNFTVHLSWRQEYCGLFRFVKDGVTYYFIDNERYFKRARLYGDYDDGERFAYFCKAIVESLPVLNFFPDIIHCNDWQSSLVSTYIKTGNWSDFRYYKIKNIYTIHNVEYQGVYGMENLKDLFGIDYRFRNDMDYNGDINLTKAAIQYSDKFTTVSESYCDNLKQPYCSRGLHHIIIRNEYKLSGIINGIDYDFYNPETDKVIYKNYNVDTLKDKVMNKKIWQDELGLPVDSRTPMLAIVSRLVSHKGLDLLSKVIEDVLQKDIQLVVVGTGDQRFVDYYKYLETKYPTKVRALVDSFSTENARKAYAASDIFLMPSKIEPCGISQMIASRYGSIPVVREVGGLKDSIKDFGCPEGGNGYTFTNYNPTDLSYQINRAIDDYQDQEKWEKKMRIAMTTDFRWSKSAQKYIDLYKSLV